MPGIERDSSDSASLSDNVTVAVSVALVALSCLVFGQARAFPFINYDDPGYVTENPNIAAGLSGRGLVWAFTHAHGGNFHPLTTLSHMLDCQLFELDPAAPHIINVLLHSASAVLLFLVFRRMTGALWRSAFVATVFAVHPLRVESVVWISERKDVLSGVAFMLTLAAYLHYVRARSFARYLAVCISLAAGLLAKPMVVTTPIVLLLLDYWPLKRMPDARTIWQRCLEKIPLFLLAAGAGVATIIAQAHMHAVETSEALPFSWRLGNAAVSYVIYLREIFWPAGLAVFYPHPENRLSVAAIIASCAVLALITIGAMMLRKRSPYLLTGWLWYLLMLAPVIGILQVGLQGHADRYTYLPGIGIAVCVAWAAVDLIGDWRIGRRTLATIAAGIVMILSCTAAIQTSYWRDSETLWMRTLAVTSDNDVAHTNLSQVLLARQRPREALEHCEAALKVRPDNAQAWTNLGLAAQQTGDVGRAVAAWQRSLELRPGGLNAEANLAWVLATSPNDTLRNGTEAVALAEDANVQTNGSNPSILRTLAAAYAEAGRFDDAVNTAESGIRLAEARGDNATAANLRFHVQNYHASLRLRDQSLTPGVTSKAKAAQD